MSGLLRGASLPWVSLERAMEAGVVLAGAVPLSPAVGPSGAATREDLLLLPDPATRTFVPAAGAPDIVLMLGDVLELDGAPWECCARYFLRRAVAALHAEFGLTLRAAFGQTVALAGVWQAAAHSLAAVADQGAFGGTLLASMRANGIEADGFETGDRAGRFRLTAKAQIGVRAADEAVVVRELARAAAAGLGRAAHVAGEAMTMRLCLVDEYQRGAMDDPAGEHGLSLAAEYVAAGILDHLPAIGPVLMPSPGSYGPARGISDLTVAGRGGALRKVAGLDGAVSELDVMVGDGAASPYLALGAVVWAGLEGLRQERRLHDVGRGAMPASLGAALDVFEESVPVAGWFGPLFREIYLRFKRAEAG